MIEFGDIVFIQEIERVGTLVGESCFYKTWRFQLDDKSLVNIKKEGSKIFLVHRPTAYNLKQIAVLIPKGYSITLGKDGSFNIHHAESATIHFVSNEAELLEKLELISRYEDLEWI